MDTNIQNVKIRLVKSNHIVRVNINICRTSDSPSSVHYKHQPIFLWTNLPPNPTVPSHCSISHTVHPDSTASSALPLSLEITCQAIQNLNKYKGKFCIQISIQFIDNSTHIMWDNFWWPITKIKNVLHFFKDLIYYKHVKNDEQITKSS